MKKVVLFTGGLDSFCLAHEVNPDVLLYFPLGLPENDREVETINSFNHLPVPVTIDPRFKLADQKLPNETLPLRNAFLILGAAYYGSQIYVASTASCTNLDTSPEFAEALKVVMSMVLADPRRNPVAMGKDAIDIHMPLHGMTKTEFVARHVERFGRHSEIHKTRSCYTSNEKECGRCQSCIGKFMALINNDLPCDFDYDPAYELRDQYGITLRNKNYKAAREVLEASIRLRVITEKEHRDALRYVEKQEAEQ